MKTEDSDDFNNSCSEGEDEEAEDPTLLEDENTCSASELAKSFSQPYKIADEKSVSLKRDYVLCLDRDEGLHRLAVGLSNGTVQHWDIDAQRGFTTLDGIVLRAPSSDDASDTQSSVGICGLRFLDETPNLLLVATSNQLIRLFDLRVGTKPQMLYVEQFNGKPAGVNAVGKFISFDRNASSRCLAVGTEQLQDHVFILFYDVRKSSSLGGFFESHKEDVTTLRFHPDDPNVMASGSTDGLINVFDVSEIDEDESIQMTINTESSVQRINWHKNTGDEDMLSCITQSNELMVYEGEEGDELASFDRAQITAAMKRTNPSNENLINIHSLSEQGDLLVLAGTNANRGEVLRSLRLQKTSLSPLTDFHGSKQIIRESLFEPKSGVLVTGGEGGIVTLWTPEAASDASTSAGGQLKIKTKGKSHKSTPY